MEYSGVVHKAPGRRFWFGVFAQSGCYSQGSTLDDTQENPREGIDICRAVLMEGKEIILEDERFVFKISVKV